MMQVNFDPLYWRVIVLGAIVAVFVVGALAIRAGVFAWRAFGRRDRHPARTVSGTIDATGPGAVHSPAIRELSVQSARNEPAPPRQFHKEAA
ncbi:MAG: hypothetical protein ABI569_03040 [Casimicrobiaceae bacterium]